MRDALAQRIYSPLRGGLTTPLADDPFGWLEHWLAGLPLATSNLELEDNLLVAHRGAATSVLIVATLPGSAYESKTQRAVHAALAQGESALRAGLPRRLGRAHRRGVLRGIGAQRLRNTKCI